MPFARRLIAALQSRRSGGRRQARQAVRRAADLRRGSVAGPRYARRRPRRSARRAGAARSRQPRALGAFRANSCRASAIRSASSTARSSRPASRRRSPPRANNVAAAARNRGSARDVSRRSRAPHRRGRRRRRCRSRAGRRSVSSAKSGCGKSVTSLAVMGLLPKGDGGDLAASVTFDGLRAARSLPDRAMRDLRGDRMAMIFQEPMTSLNPSLHGRRADHRGAGAPSRARASARRARSAIALLQRVRHSLAERAHRRLSAQALRRHAPARDDRHGARLRSRTADRRRADHRARRHHPGADPRPDARRCKRTSGTAIMLITHDLGVVAEMCDEVAVMYAGEIVERAPGRRAVRGAGASLHGRAAGLDPAARRARERLAAIEGVVPEHDRAVQSAAVSPRAARSCWRNAAPRRRRWSSSADGHWSRCLRSAAGTTGGMTGRWSKPTAS